MVGIQYETQRRNRLNATVKEVQADTLHLHVDQSFGNCPKYIQVRHRIEDAADAPKETCYLPALNAASTKQIMRADSLFIASRSPILGDDPRAGVDINHRGGMPGFVSIVDPYTLEFPDYKGNNFFNTFGNIVNDGRVSLQFTDFETGTLLSVKGHAELLDLPEAQEPLTGTLVRIHIEEVARTVGAFPHRYRFGAYSDKNPEV